MTDGVWKRISDEELSYVGAVGETNRYIIKPLQEDGQVERRAGRERLRT